MNQMQYTSSRRFTHLYVLPTLFLLLAFVSSPQPVQGQWTTHGTSTADINNTNTGNVGIGTGTTAPSQRLVVNGNGLFGGTATRTEVMTGFSFTINPALLEINSGVEAANDARYSVLSLVTNQPGTANLVGGIYFSNNAYAGADKRLASITSGTDGNVNAGDLRFATSGAGGPVDRMRITPAGRIGVNMNNPVGLFNVTGNGANFFDASTYHTLVNAQQSTLGSGQTRYTIFGAVNVAADNNTGSGVYGYAAGGTDSNFAQGSATGVRGYAAAPLYTTDSNTFMTYGGHFVGDNPNTGGHGNPQHIYGIYAKASSSSTVYPVTGTLYAGYFENGITPGNVAYGIYQATGGAKNYFAGNVGIGTTAPAYKLDVNGEINATGLRINGTPISAGGSPSQWTTGNSSLYYNTGNVGLGTTNPGARLDVVQPIGAAIRALSGSLTAHASIQIGRTQGEGTLAIAGNAGDYAHTAQPGDVILRTEAGNKKLFLSNGPDAATVVVANSAVNVTGNLTVSGTITGDVIGAKYQDVAEWVPSSQKLEAGTVVALDPERSNQVLASSEAYDTRVAGVISPHPGIALGERGEGKVLVATTGRVKVKVDATRSAIKIGDLLVTSDVQGVAMKSEAVNVGGRKMHSPGTIIGKALEPLDKGTGEILVLLSLQ